MRRGGGGERRHFCAPIVVCLALTGVIVVSAEKGALAGHMIGHYPSYYPDEIRINTVDPTAAATGLEDGTLHAYAGGTPAFAGRIADHVKPLASLRSLVVLTFDPAAASLASAERRCAAARELTSRFVGVSTAGFVFHPYPITPYHPDYLHHLDRATAARDAVSREPTRATVPAVEPRGPLATSIVGRHQPGGVVVLEEVPLDTLISDAALRLDGWLGPPWSKEGWFQAYRLLAPALDAASRQAADDVYLRLVRGEVVDLADQVDSERRLIAMLTGDCRRTVVGYTLRKEYINDAFSAGIENVAHDSHAGLGAPIFIRTAKLKDYPWNGSLRLGVPKGSEAAWNPVAGFTDLAGRLTWAAISDPAMIPFPSNGSWISNRVQATVAAAHGQSGGLPVPGDALRPEADNGTLRPVPPRTFASAKVTYETIASPFQDGTETEAADILYPFVFGYRWGAVLADRNEAREPSLAAPLAAIRERLVGLRSVGVNRTVMNIAPGFDVVHKSPVIEVYLKNAPGDDHQIAALAPPWTTIPWHLLALMEEAVMRGYAAFSEQEARRHAIPWLDLVRDKALHDKLMTLVQEFAQARFRPDALAGLVGAEDAERRWRALQAFGKQNGHFLVTNGPYRLKSWTPDSIVLSAVREATYPLGFGTFDSYVNAPRAVIREVKREGNKIAVVVDADITVKVVRHYEIKREPLTRRTAQGTRGVLVASRYLLIGPNGSVARAGRMRWEQDDRFTADLPTPLPPGRHTAVVGVFLDGNLLTPSTGMFTFGTDREN